MPRRGQISFRSSFAHLVMVAIALKYAGAGNPLVTGMVDTIDKRSVGRLRRPKGPSKRAALFFFRKNLTG